MRISSAIFAITPLLSLLLSACLLVPAVPAQAEHRGHKGHAKSRNRASFQVEAVREIANDWATARLSIVAEGKEAAAVATEVNKAMAKALTRAKRARGVEVRSGSYTTRPVYDDGQVVRWRASQDLRLESSDVDRLSELIGELQGESILLADINFGVRGETRKALEDELISEALAAFRTRADLVAKGMGAAVWSLVDVSVGTTNSTPRRIQQDRMRMQSFKSSAPPPSFEAGTSEIRVQATGEVELD
jgi:predicted secreted protein